MSPLLAILIIVGIVFLLLISIQLLMAIFTSFRSWKFSSILLLVMLVSVWFLINLYANTVLAPGIEERVREEVTAELQEGEDGAQIDTPEATESPESKEPAAASSSPHVIPSQDAEDDESSGNASDLNCNGILDGLESETTLEDDSLCHT